MRIKTILTSVGIGAVVMYFLDPRHGHRRRGLVRDRLNSFIDQMDVSIDRMREDTRNRARGILSEMTARLSDQSAPDWLLEERVRSAVGRVTRYSRLLDIRSNRGHMLISGPVLRADKEQILKSAARARGVYSLQDEMQVFETAKDLPALQIPNTGTYTYSDHPRPRQDWSTATRLLSGVGGSLLTLYGLKRKGLSRSLFSTAGLLLTTRSVINKDTMTLLGISPSGHGFKIRKAININAPIDEVYRFWHNFENFKLFMYHVKQISVQDDIASWKVAGPAGAEVEFRTHITSDIPNELIRWETLPDSSLKHTGLVRFDGSWDGGTRVSVEMEYLPVKGAVAPALAELFGVDPRPALSGDLVRFKTLFEESRSSASTGTVTLSGD